MSENSKKKSRRFATNDPVLDQIYEEINQDLYQRKELLKPFEYEFEEESGTHTLTYMNLLRFIKKNDSPVIDLRVRLQNDNNSDEWGDFKTHARQQYGEIIVSNGKGLRSPVMWPVMCTNGSLAQVESALPSRIHEISSKYIKKPQKNYFGHYENIKDSPLFSDSDKEILLFNEKLFKMGFAIQKIWMGKFKKYRHKNNRSAVCKWWEHFVDRPSFKMFATVLGNSKNSCLTWPALALFTQEENFQETIKHVSSMNGERIHLRQFEPSEWKSQTFKTLLHPSWHEVWGDVTKLPTTVQQLFAVAAGASNRSAFAEESQGELDDIFSNSNQGPLKNPRLKSSNDFDAEIKKQSGVPGLWLVFNTLKKQRPEKKWKPRDLSMLFTLSYEVYNSISSQYQVDTPTKIQLFHQTLNNLTWASDYIQVYKENFSEDYKKWSMTHINAFKNFSSGIAQNFIKSGGDDNVLFENDPISYYGGNQISEKKTIMKNAMEKIALTKELSENEKVKKKKTKKRSM